MRTSGLGIGAALAVALTGCGGGSWELPEEARLAVSRTAQQRDPSLSFDWPSGLPGDSSGLLRETALVLDDVGAFVAEVDRRHAQALTEEERARLAEVRHDAIEHLFEQVSQLASVLSWWRARPPTQQLALVCEELGPPPNGGKTDPRTQPVKISHLAVLEAQERPMGIYVRGVSLPLALRAFRDGLVEWARDKGALTPASREKLGLEGR